MAHPAFARAGLTAALLALGLVVAPLAQAKEAPPTYSAETLIPTDEDELPGGAKLADTQGGEGLPCPATLDPLAKGAGLDDVSYYAEVRTLQAGGATANAAMIDIDADPAAFRMALDAAAGTNAWSVIELGSPHRLLVVGGPEAARNAVASSLEGHVVLELVEMAVSRLFAPARSRAAAKGARASAARLLTQARAIDGEAGAVHTLDAVLELFERNRLRGEASTAERLAKQGVEGKEALKKEHEAAAKAAEDRMLASARRAFAPGVGTQARGPVVPFLAGEAGQAWLATKDDAVLGDAVQILELAMANEGTDSGAQRKFENRYNLACAYARQAKNDKAFTWLEKAMEVGKTLPGGRYGPAFLHMRDTDEDLTDLREDPRWDKLVETFHTDAVKAYVKRKEELEAKRKEREAAKDKPASEPEAESAPGDDTEAESDDEPAEG